MRFRAGSFGAKLFMLILCSIAPSAGTAQAASGEVPMDLVVALLGGQNRGLRVFVDELPPEVAGRVPLKGGLMELLESARSQVEDLLMMIPAD